jgi:hypothetical protein
MFAACGSNQRPVFAALTNRTAVLRLLFFIGRVRWNTCAISGFHREADENCALLGYYTASGNFLP